MVRANNAVHESRAIAKVGFTNKTALRQSEGGQSAKQTVFRRDSERRASWRYLRRVCVDYAHSAAASLATPKFTLERAT